MKHKLIGFIVSIVLFSNITAKEAVKPNLCRGPVLCPVAPFDGSDDCCHRLHIDIGLLYQQPSFEGLNAGYSYEPEFNIATGSPFPLQEIKDLNQCLEYAIGLTASLGRRLEHDHWYLGARFDWLESRGGANYDNVDRGFVYQLRYNENLNENVFSFSGFSPDTDYLDKIIYSANFNMYWLDIFLSRGSYHSKCFTYEPFAGIKALWFSTEQNASYYATSMAGDNGGYVTWNESQDNWGVGLAFGLNAEYFPAARLSFFSDSDIALLYGEASEINTSTLIRTERTDINTQEVREDKGIDCILYVPVRTILGVKFSRYCFDERHYFALKLGYDLRAVFSYPEVDRGFIMSGLYTNLIWNF